MGIMKHGFVVAGDKDYLDAVLHNLLPPQSFISIWKLRDICGAEQHHSPSVFGRCVVQVCGDAGPRIVECGLGEGKSKDALKDERHAPMAHEERLQHGIAAVMQHVAGVTKLLSSIDSAESIRVKLKRGNQPVCPRVRPPVPRTFGVEERDKPNFMT